ncbi:Bug family tripartite tricarboxylate transporter substrate binding protein [Variovorax terrae]|uniref:Tripartite tricarboxylate transporter substrate binding protein n=1 Tax=Variovorax terrae TaxID=2923278 RepID=A0A9X2APF0_9BURK|nr:tripartite tricarboxylate transporter substrate binding protein [Variovorax terrae]MCJ0763417.1 tripartite tricarboxylate transporter substrate binding protein [Variovorax terrae]
MRRAFLLKMAAASLALVATLGSAATPPFPVKPVRIIIGFAAGGTTDLVGRLVAQRLGEAWGQTVVVENRTGASGMIAAEAVAKAAPDGYTLLVSPQTSLAVAPALYGKATYDTMRDFSPITLMGSTPTIMVVNPAFPVKTFAEFVDFARRSQTPVSYGSGGVGSSPHMAGELLSAQLGIRQTHVPYKGENPALIDTIGGQVPIMYGNVSAVVNQIKAGKLRAIANTGSARSPLLPEVPTIAESGLKDFAIATWFGLLGPAGMPAEQVARIQRDVARVLGLPEVRSRFAELGVDIVANTPEEFGTYLRGEVVRYTKVIKDAGIKPE